MVWVSLGCFLCMFLGAGVMRLCSHESSPCRCLTALGLALPLAGTVYEAARRRGSDGRASPLPPATDPSLPLREMQRTEPRHGAGCLAQLSLSGTPSRGKGRHSKNLRPLTRGDSDELQSENKSFGAGI